MSVMRAVGTVAVRAAGKRSVMTTAAHEYATLKEKIPRQALTSDKLCKHAPFLNSRDKALNDVWAENAVFFYSLALTPFALLVYLQ